MSEPGPELHPTLRRLDRFATVISETDDALAVLGLGSAGVEYDRFDDHSDIDFFLVVRDADAKRRYLEDIGWLEGFGAGLGSGPAYSFVNDANGRKALYADGLFLEYAVFTPDELPAIPFVGARVVWSRPGVQLDVSGPGPAPRPALDTAPFHLGEALTNLYVGLHRELRGERLTAMRFIQVYAVDQVLALARLADSDRVRQRDPFEPTRRVDQAYGDELPLASMVPGYSRKAAAAAATFDWLDSRYDVDPVVGQAITDLVAQASD